MYERRAELQYADPPAPDARLDRKFERVLELVAQQLPADRFLDAGCGDGRHLAAVAQLAERPRELTGTDISERILETARVAAGPEPRLVRANLEALPFPDASFDLVLCTQVVEHLLDPARGLAELARVLAPGGRAVITTDNRRALVTKALNAPRAALVALLRLRHRRFVVEFPHESYDLEGFAKLVREAGLEISQAETFRFMLFWPLNARLALRLLNAVDRRLPPHRVGDLLALVARKPL